MNRSPCRSRSSPVRYRMCPLLPSLSCQELLNCVLCLGFNISRGRTERVRVLEGGRNRSSARRGAEAPQAQVSGPPGSGPATEGSLESFSLAVVTAGSGRGGGCGVSASARLNGGVPNSLRILARTLSSDGAFAMHVLLVAYPPSNTRRIVKELVHRTRCLGVVRGGAELGLLQGTLHLSLLVSLLEVFALVDLLLPTGDRYF